MLIKLKEIKNNMIRVHSIHYLVKVKSRIKYLVNKFQNYRIKEEASLDSMNYIRKI